jgi:hypothetical protein
MGSIRCLDCGDVITSKSTHDFVRCGCGNSFVDGGDSYTRAGGNIVFLSEQQVSDSIPTPTTRQRFREEGKKIERERILKLLKESHVCQHDSECNKEFNIYNIVKANFNVDLEKLLITDNRNGDTNG